MATPHDSSRPTLSVIQSLLENGHTITLSPRDLAFLILVYDELEQSDEPASTVSSEILHALHVTLDTIDPRDSQTAERRLNESLHRLSEANCLARVDLQRLHREAHAEYHVTPIGEAIARWYITESEFSGEPLTAIFRTFINELTHIAEAGRTTPLDQWTAVTLQPLQYALKGMLLNIQHHQKELDRQHEELRRFLSTLLTQGTEDSIQQCESQLARVIATIADLQEVVLASTNTADTLIDRIAQHAPHEVRSATDTICEDLTKRLQQIAKWTAKRAVDWVDHHHIVHNFLRTVVRVDRQRRVTESLKRAIAEAPTWTMEVASPTAFFRMRDAIRDPIPKVPPRLSKNELSQPRDVEDVEPDTVPLLLQRYLTDALQQKEARASVILRLVMNDSHIAPAELVKHFPWLLSMMTDAGMLDSNLREWIPTGPTLDIEEIRVTSP